MIRLPQIPYGKYAHQHIDEIQDLEFLLSVKDKFQPRIRKAIRKQINNLNTRPKPSTPIH